jgi:tetratricopeptide (TPR) repeat protein
MLEGFDFGTPKIAAQLTGKLAALRHYNGMSIPPEYFMEAMERLRNRFLNIPLSAVLHPVSPSAQQAVQQQKTAAAAAPEVQEQELTAQQWFERGFAAIDIGEQLRFYTEAIRLKPDDALAFNNRGLARRDKGDLDGALQDYTEAIRLKPDFALAFYNRGLARRDKGDLDGALQDYTEAIRLKPDDALAFNNRGVAGRDKGDLDGALQDYTEAVRLNGGRNLVDCGLALLADDSDVQVEFPDGTRLHTDGPITPTPQMNVTKYGAITDKTIGTIVDTDVDLYIDYSFGTFHLEHQIMIEGHNEAFAAAGDSGSIVFESSTRKPVAMIFAATGGFAVACPLDTVLKELAKTIPGQPVPALKLVV